MLPDPEEFPYTIRVISDILESNGSSSMACVCGATLGLMAAGVPITQSGRRHLGRPGEGIGRQVGACSPTSSVTKITIGDMDFKIAGTQNGITGIQLDLKIDGHQQAKSSGRRSSNRAKPGSKSCASMLTAISRPKEDISECAPRLIRTTIDPEKIGLLIGPGGKNIRGIQESTGTVIEVDDDGIVTIASSNREWAEAALAASRSAHRHRANRQDLQRSRQQHQGLWRVCRNPAGPRWLVPYQRTVWRIRQPRRRCLPRRRRNESHRHRCR